MIDWSAIKTEYITTNTSYRKLAEKYGVNVTNIAKRAGAEGWVEQRKQYASETQAKTLEIISRQKVARAKKIETVADKLLNKIEAMVDRVGIQPKDVRSLVAAVKDLKEIQGVRSELDEKEQKARIAHFEQQANKGTESKDIRVEFEGELDEFSG